MSTTLPYLDADLPVETRIEDLVGRMTLEEKASQLLHSAAAVERLGVPAYDWWNEALHGIARSGKATVFPQAIGIAATFNVELMEQIASVISDEGRAKHHAAVRRGNRSRYTGLTFWSPNVNIFRDPRWGRGQETFGEDPFLTAELGGAFVHGMQGDHPRYLKTAACAKHFAVHSGPEALRHEFDAVAEEKDLQETYLPAFEHLVKEGVEAIMGAYNRTNGEPCCASADLMGRLRDEWGFQGHFLSDCWAVRDFHEHHHVTETPEESVALALSHGCDLNCGCTYERVLAAVRQGLLDEAFVDASLRRLLQTRFRLGMFDPPEQVPWSDTPSSVVDCEAHRALARKAAVQSMVLLKNDNAILPLREDIRRIAVLGHNAAAVQPLLGNYYGLNSRLVTVLEGIIGRVPDGVSVEYRHACLMDRPNPNSAGWAIGDAGSYEVAIAVVGLSELFEGEEGDAILSPTKGDRDRIELPEPQCTFLERLMDTGVPTVVVVMSGSPIAMPEIVEKAAAVLWAWYPGEEGGNAIADVLFGDASPAGRLPITFPVSTEQLPPFEDYAMAGRTYKYAREAPMFPFGYGLTYTTIEYRALRTDQDVVAAGATVTVEVDVANTGAQASDEVVQLYVKHTPGSETPNCSLVAFSRVTLDAGESRTVALPVTGLSLARFAAGGKRVFGEACELVAGPRAPMPGWDTPTSDFVRTTIRLNE